MVKDKPATYDISPKEAAISVEEFLHDCGYVMDDLRMIEVVGSRTARYDFSERLYPNSL